MTPADRALLARAAQAAGKSRAEWDYDWLVERGVDVSRDMLWNPLDNSGQALELAVQLDVWPYASSEVRIGVWQQQDDGRVKDVYGVDCMYGVEPMPNGINWATDRLSATRRAITIAAGARIPA